MQVKNPLVSIITVNYRQATMTCELLDSIANNAYKNVEVIVVDNGSQKNCTLEFQKHYPSVKTVISTENLGFAGGNNIGTEQATGDFYFFVNNDTVFTEGLIENILARFTKNEKIGAISPKIRYFDTPNIIQYAGFTEMGKLTGRNETIGKDEDDKGQHDTARTTPYAHGAAMMVRKEAIRKAGVMPEQFFLYYEELDWCCRIREAGFEIWYEPSAVIYHKESASVGKLSPLKVYYQNRNRLLFMKRNTNSLPHLGLFLTYFYTITYPIKSLSWLLKKDMSNFMAFQKAVWGLKFV
jgi:GT2 family glycosyltransferase